MFDGTPGTDLHIISDGELTVVSPPHAAGEAVVSVVASGRFSDTPFAVLYTDIGIESVQPSAGPLAGGVLVTLTGWGFTGATSVTFGGTPGISLSVADDTSLTVIAPPHAAGDALVEVTSPAGTGGGVSFTYAAGPEVTEIAPTSGPPASESLVALTGTNFYAPLSVTFGGVSATIMQNSPTSLLVRTPAHAVGPVPVVVTAAGGVSDGAATYTFITPPVKRTLLAWAGQRVVLEHDWRTPPGDNADGTPVGTCPFAAPDNVVTYTQSSGPGNFIPALGADILALDTAEVAISGASQMETIPATPQGACISRVVHESEDPGEADIEAQNLADPYGVKVDFVIYYMKFEGVDLSLVPQVENPFHNLSVRRVFAPGNPWAAAMDAPGDADWDISKDLLVRGRVRGWFLNAVPSGRDVDNSDPTNVLPADRWVLPDDWAVLAGGPVDNADGSPATGTAETFRPAYDMMFGPNNAAGIGLAEIAEGNQTQVARVTTAAGVTNTATTFAVTSVSNLAPGSVVAIGWGAEARTVTATTTTPPTITLNAASPAVPAAGTEVWLSGPVAFVGPYSTLDIVFGGGVSATYGSLAVTNGGVAGAAPGLGAVTRDTVLGDGDINMWDAPMPPAPVSVRLRGTGFIKQVMKWDVYWTGDYDSGRRVYPNPYYAANIPASPFLPAVVAGGGYAWDSWGSDGPAGGEGAWSSTSDGESGDGPYGFWMPIPAFLVDGTPGTDMAGASDATVTAAQLSELFAIRGVYSDDTIARDLVLYSDNHGEFMVVANGDFKQDYSACAVDTVAGGRHCAPGDQVGTGTVSAVADYPDFRGKFAPAASNSVAVDWRWRGYIDFSVEPGESAQFAYLVVHALDRDGFCDPPDVPQPPELGVLEPVSLHPVLTALDGDAVIGTEPLWMLDLALTGDGVVVGTSGGGQLGVGSQSVEFVHSFSTAANDPNTGVKEFPLSPLAAVGQSDECQAWVRISNSLLTPVTFTATVHDDAGDLGFVVGDVEPPDAAEAIAFTGQPLGATGAGVTLTGTPQVTALDGEGDTDTAFAGAVTLSLAGGTPGAVLTCAAPGLTRDPVNGVATFDGCSIDLAGGSYRLVASALGLPDVESGFFSVLGPLAPATAPSYGDGPGVGVEGVAQLGASPPGGVVAAAAGTVSATVHWSDNSTDETGFRVLRIGGTGPNGGTWTQVGADLPANTTSLVDSPLEPGTYYAYWVVALKGAQLFYAPTYMTVITPLAPAKPVPVAAMGLNSTQVAVYWRDNSPDEDGFRILRYISGVWTNVSGDLPADSFGFVDGNDAAFPLAPGQTYAYWVTAFKGAETVGVSYAPAYIAASTPLTDVPNAPQHVSGSSTATTATIQWMVAGGTAAQDGYQVIRQGPGGWDIVSGPDPLPEAPTAFNDFTDTGLTPGTYYAYWVYGLNGGAKTYAGSYITVVTAIPPPPQPVSAAGAGSGAVHLTWTDFATGEDGFDIRRYDGSAWVVVGSVGPDVTEYTDSGGLAAGVTYAYWLVARTGTVESYAGAYIAATAY